MVYATPDKLPVFDPPADNAPIVGVIDSGVLAGHPLLQSCVVAAVTLTAEFHDGADEAGHGTQVAGAILHGRLEHVIGDDRLARPLCRLLSVKVLDKSIQFPKAELWERDLVEAVRYCADAGARIINLSIGNGETPYRGPRSAPVAALLDQLARDRQLVIVVSAGNIELNRYTMYSDELIDQYPTRLLESDESAILDPAPAALALTVGGLCHAEAAGGVRLREVASVRPMGAPGWPSPFSRVGPGIAGAIKPELSAEAGSMAIDMGLRQVVKDVEVSRLLASARPDRVLGADVGTSYAAPLVTRIAAGVAGRYPELSSNLVRALVLQATMPGRFEAKMGGATLAARRTAVRRLIGYGEARYAEAIGSSDHRAVLVAQNSIPINGVHICGLSHFVGVRGAGVTEAVEPVQASGRALSRATGVLTAR